MSPSSDDHKRSTLLSFLILIVVSGVVIHQSASVAGIIFGTVGGLSGIAVGLALAAWLMVQQRRLRLHPMAWLTLALVVIPLYFLLVSVLLQIDTVVLPPYLPGAWVKQAATAVLGFLMGGGIPILLYALVTEGYRLLD